MPNYLVLQKEHWLGIWLYVKQHIQYWNTMLKKHKALQWASATKEHTIMPEAEISAVVFGSLIFITRKGIRYKEFCITIISASKTIIFTNWKEKQAQAHNAHTCIHNTYSIWMTFTTIEQMKLALGLYVTIRVLGAWRPIALRSNLRPQFTVETIFLQVKTPQAVISLFCREGNLLHIPTFTVKNY